MDDLFVAENDAVQKRLIAAVRSMERELARDPHSVGESRDGANRVAFFDGLFVRFSIDSVNRTVRIHVVRRFGS